MAGHAAVDISGADRADEVRVSFSKRNVRIGREDQVVVGSGIDAVSGEPWNAAGFNVFGGIVAFVLVEDVIP